MNANDNNAPHRGDLKRYVAEIFATAAPGQPWQNVTIAEEVERRHGWRPTPAAIRYQLAVLRAEGLIRPHPTARLCFEAVPVSEEV